MVSGEKHLPVDWGSHLAAVSRRRATGASFDSLHDEGGQKTDIADYVRHVVNSPSDVAMGRWAAVIEIL